MSIVVISHEPEPWYRREPWPLLPKWNYRAANEWNPADWGLSWLFFSVWTGSAINLGLWVEVDGTGLRIQAHLPYLHIRLTPIVFPAGWHQWGWRVGLIERSRRTTGGGRAKDE